MYNKSFKLDPSEIELIEICLRKEQSRIVASRQTTIDSTIVPPDQISSVREYDEEIKNITTLLGRLHEQKNWYRPKDKVYVSG